MAQTKEQIKRAASNRPGTYVSPHFGDGGWHTTPGCLEFTTEWEPLRDRILLRMIPMKLKYESIVRPENAAMEETTRHAIVLKVGPGPWIEGINGGIVRQPLDVKVGDEVIIGKWHDWQTADAGWGENIIICQEKDVRVIVNKKAMSA